MMYTLLILYLAGIIGIFRLFYSWNNSILRSTAGAVLWPVLAVLLAALWVYEKVWKL